MQIAVMVPMVTELKPLRRVAQLVEGRRGDVAVHEGAVGSADVVATLVGIGPALAKRATGLLLDACPVDHVVVCGIAGGLPDAVKVGQLVVPEVVVDHQSGERFAATPLGPVAPAGSLVTSGELLTDDGALGALVADGHCAIDMETAAVAQVCVERDVPWTAFRGISDMAGDGLDDAVMGLVGPDGGYRLGAAVRFALTRPWRIPALGRLGRGLDVAAKAAAAATVAACA